MNVFHIMLNKASADIAADIAEQCSRIHGGFASKSAPVSSV